MLIRKVGLELCDVVSSGRHAEMKKENIWLDGFLPERFLHFLHASLLNALFSTWQLSDGRQSLYRKKTSLIDDQHQGVLVKIPAQFATILWTCIVAWYPLLPYIVALVIVHCGIPLFLNAHCYRKLLNVISYYPCLQLTAPWQWNHYIKWWPLLRNLQLVAIDTSSKQFCHIPLI